MRHGKKKCGKNKKPFGVDLREWLGAFWGFPHKQFGAKHTYLESQNVNPHMHCKNYTQ